MEVWNTGGKVRSCDNVWQFYLKLWIPVSLAHGLNKSTLGDACTKSTVLRQEFQFPQGEATK